MSSAATSNASISGAVMSAAKQQSHPVQPASQAPTEIVDEYEEGYYGYEEYAEEEPLEHDPVVEPSDAGESSDDGNFKLPRRDTGPLRHSGLKRISLAGMGTASAGTASVGT